MAWGFVAGAAISVIGGAIAADGAKSASRAQQRSADAATNEQARQYDQTRTDFADWRTAGQGAIGRLTSASNGDMSSFQASPDYNFVRSEGQRDMGNSFAARGGAFSGNALRALDQYNQHLASGQFNNWWNQQAGLAGVGQSATNATAAAGENAANNISNNYLAAGNARASGIASQANTWGSLANSLGSYGAYRWGQSPNMMNQPSGGSGYGPQIDSHAAGLAHGWGSGEMANNALWEQGYG